MDSNQTERTVGRAIEIGTAILKWKTSTWKMAMKRPNSTVAHQYRPTMKLEIIYLK